uniref:C-type lectin domain-containing protein n=1 Tax=Neogobius melanostomus TaxID=47308 RepID=A0A8C6TDI1_9GOBI
MHVNTTPHCSFRLISICLQLLILRCPLQWESVESSCFYFSRASLNWHDARDWCHAHQSQLLILTDDKDWDYMRSHVGHTFYWVGLTDEGGKWEWVNGTPYTIDHCAHIHLDGRLNDLHCSERLRFICPQELLQTSKR